MTPFLFNCILIGAFLIFLFWEQIFNFYVIKKYKSQLVYDTLKGQPRRKRILPYKELMEMSLTEDERSAAINTMALLLEEKRALTPEHRPYAQYTKSLQFRFSSDVAFAYAQCHFNIFEESGFETKDTLEKRQFTLLFPERL